ncbi:hypothetical protein ACQEVX_05075 [Streptomyces syringium]|uniref:hypothetical protein n=1 Tax=Streptomyces syringium TaxID=76729 RepID=UPI003D8EB86B
MHDGENTPDALDELIILQRASNAEYEKLRALQDEYGRPTLTWTEEQRAACQAQLKAWTAAATEAYAARERHPAAATMGRYELEMAVKKAARDLTPAG